MTSPYRAAVYACADASDYPPQLWQILKRFIRQDDAEVLFKAGEYFYYFARPQNAARAVAYYRRAAKLGHNEARYRLAYCHEYGFGVRTDLKKARRYYAAAAENGHHQAAYALGRFWEYGFGGKHSLKTACRLYHTAARGGCPEAQNAFAYCCDQGRGTSRKPQKARRWYTRAAKQGNAQACNNLGILYRYGQSGLRQCCRRAEKWFQLAAAAGSLTALYNLGELYEHKKRYRKALKYYRRAAELGDKPSRRAAAKLQKNR